MHPLVCYSRIQLLYQQIQFKKPSIFTKEKKQTSLSPLLLLVNELSANYLAKYQNHFVPKMINFFPLLCCFLRTHAEAHRRKRTESEIGQSIFKPSSQRLDDDLKWNTQQVEYTTRWLHKAIFTKMVLKPY